MKKQRKVYIDILRTIACFAVIFNHFDPGFYNCIYVEAGGLSYFVMLTISILCKFAVPLFFMISGALLLGKKETITILYKKRVMRMMLALLFASVVYYIFEKYVMKSGVRLLNIYGGGMLYHLWYLYAYITFLLILPLLRIISEKLTKNLMIYMLCIYGILSVIAPIIELLFLNGSGIILNDRISNNPIALNIFIFPIVGYFIENKIDCRKISKTNILRLLVINFISIIVSVLMSYIYLVKNGGLGQQYVMMFAPLHAATLYLLAKKYNIGSKIKERWQNVILSISATTFGIYILHMIPMRILITNSDFLSFYNGSALVTRIIVWALVSVAIFFTSFVVVYIFIITAQLQVPLRSLV